MRHRPILLRSALLLLLLAACGDGPSGPPEISPAPPDDPLRSFAAPVLDIAAGAGHACVLAADRTVSCWGENSFGQTAAPEGEFTAIAAGINHTCDQLLGVARGRRRLPGRSGGRGRSGGG